MEPIIRARYNCVLYGGPGTLYHACRWSLKKYVVLKGAGKKKKLKKQKKN